LEEAIDASVNRLPNVELYLGWDVMQVEQSEDLAVVTMRNSETGETRRLSARYVVGCDGANSLVRKTIGGEQEDRGFEANWLVVDVLLKDGRTIESLGIPGAAQYCHPDYPTTIVPAGIRGGRTFRRWEFMQLPGEDVQDMEREDNVWKRLKPWVGPEDVELVRHRVYNFRSLLAQKWRDGRLIIAGDAAHVMPPFLGQGMCSGFRDAWNLAWKLNLILGGQADGRLLDTYQPERMPHVSQIIDMSIFLGKIICMPDAKEAVQRDAVFLSGNAPPMPPFPSLVNGLLHRDADGKIAKGAGLLALHADFQAGNRRGRQDDLFGPGFLIIARGDPEKSLDKPTRDALAVLGATLISLGHRNSAYFAEDITGRYRKYLARQGWTAMTVRPDYYVYGGVGADAELQSLVSNLLADMARVGVDRVT
jgi:2-polyprenyl-6-methoxyphenol hydroxylase-like FAD-dependent oxidoreductase